MASLEGREQGALDGSHQRGVTFLCLHPENQQGSCGRSYGSAGPCEFWSLNSPRSASSHQPASLHVCRWPGEASAPGKLCIHRSLQCGGSIWPVTATLWQTSEEQVAVSLLSSLLVTTGRERPHSDASQWKPRVQWTFNMFSSPTKHCSDLIWKGNIQGGGGGCRNQTGRTF